MLMSLDARAARWIGSSVLLVVGLFAGSPPALAQAEDPPVRRAVLGATEPENAPGQSLTLQRVTIAPNAQLPDHFHAGTQLAAIRSGVLTYNVVSGAVTLTRKGAAAETVAAPAKIKLRPGDVIVEPESLVHSGANRGKRPVAIDLTALLRDGAELSAPTGSGAAGAAGLALSTTLTSTSRTLYQVGPNNASTYGTNRLIGTAMAGGQPVGVEMLGSVDYTSGNGPFSGFVTFTFADGATIGVTMQGTTTAAANGTDASFAATLGVIGGTGQYSDATGEGTFTGTRSAALCTDVGAEFVLSLRTKRS